MAAFVLGAIAYFGALDRGLSYSERNRQSSTGYLVFAGLVLVLGFVLTLGLDHARYRIGIWIFAGVCVGHIFVINSDLRMNSSNHNLLPLEFIVLAVVCSPVFLGIALAHAAGWLRK